MTLISVGVPQGSTRIICPLLFYMYASDQSVIQNIIVADYVDEKAIISIHEVSLIASANLQSYLSYFAIVL